MELHWQEMKEHILWNYLRDGLGAINKEIRNIIIEKIKEIIDKKGDYINLLDVGCGTGALYEDIINADLPIKYIGLDVTPKIIGILREKFPRGIWIEKNLHDFNFNDNTFDVIVCKDVFEHIYDFKTPFHDFIRSAKFRIIISFFNFSDLAKKTIIQCLKENYYWNITSKMEVESFLKTYLPKVNWTTITFYQDEKDIKSWAKKHLKNNSQVQKGKHCIYCIDK